jgi:hypothetical protein
MGSISEAVEMNSALLSSGQGLPSAADLPAAASLAGVLTSNNEQRLRRQLSAMRTRLGELWAEVRRQVAEVGNLREENTSLKENIREGNRRVRQLQTNTEEYEDLLQIRGREADQIRERLSNTGTQSDELQGALDEKSAENAKLEEALEQQVLELHELRVETDALRQERDQAVHAQQLHREQQNMQLRYKSELETCKSDLQRANRTAAAEKRKAGMDLHIELETLKKAKAHAESRRAELNQQFTDEKAEWMESQKQIEDEHAQLVGQLEDQLVTQLEEMQEEKRRVLAAQEECVSVKTLLATTAEDLRRQRKDHTQVQHENEKLMMQVQEVLELEQDDLGEEEGEEGEGGNPLKHLQGLEVGQMRLVWKQIQRSNRSVTKAQHDTKATQQEADRLQQQVGGLQKEHALLLTKLRNKDTRCDELQKETTALTLQLQKNHQDCDKIRETSASLQQHAHQLEVQYKKVSDKLKKAQEALAMQTEEHERLQQEQMVANAKKSAELLEVGRGKQEGVAGGAEEGAGLERMRQRCDRLQESKMQLEGQVKKMQQQTLSHCLTLRAVEKQHKERVVELENQNTGLQAAACSLEKELKGQLEAAKTKHKQELKTTVQEYKDRCVAVRASRKEQQGQLLQLQEKYSEQVVELDEQKTVSLELQRAFDKLQQTLERTCVEKEQACVEREQLRQWQQERQHKEGQIEKNTAAREEEEQQEEATRSEEQRKQEEVLRENEIECEQLRRANSVMFKTVQNKGRAWKELQEQVDAVKGEKQVLQEEMKQLQDKHRVQQQQRKEQRLVESQYHDDTARQHAVLESKIQKLEAQRGMCEHKHVDKQKLEVVEEKRVAAALRATEMEREKGLIVAKWEQEKVLHEQLKQDKVEKIRLWRGQEEKLKQRLGGREVKCAELECSVAKLEGRLKAAEKRQAEVSRKGETEVKAKEEEACKARDQLEAAAHKALEGHEAALQTLQQKLGCVEEELKTRVAREEVLRVETAEREVTARKMYDEVTKGLQEEVAACKEKHTAEEQVKAELKQELEMAQVDMQEKAVVLQAKVAALETELKKKAAEQGRHLEALNGARVEKSRTLKAMAALTASHTKQPGTCQGCAQLNELKGRAEGVEKIKESLHSAMTKSELRARNLKIELRETVQQLQRVEAELRENNGTLRRQERKVEALEEELTEQSRGAEADRERATTIQRHANERQRHYQEQADLLRVQVESTQTRAANFEAEVGQLREANSLGEHVWKKAEMERGRLARETRVLEEEVAEQSKECTELQQRNRQLRRELLTVHSYFGVSVSPQAMMAMPAKCGGAGRPGKSLNESKADASNHQKTTEAVRGVGKIKAIKAQAQLEEARQRSCRDAELRAHETLQMKLEDLNSSSQQNLSLKEDLKLAKKEVQLVKEQVAAEQAKRLFQVGVLSYKKEQSRLCSALS